MLNLEEQITQLFPLFEKELIREMQKVAEVKTFQEGELVY